MCVEWVTRCVCVEGGSKVCVCVWRWVTRCVCVEGVTRCVCGGDNKVCVCVEGGNNVCVCGGG